MSNEYARAVVSSLLDESHYPTVYNFLADPIADQLADPVKLPLLLTRSTTWNTSSYASYWVTGPVPPQVLKQRVIELCHALDYTNIQLAQSRYMCDQFYHHRYRESSSAEKHQAEQINIATKKSGPSEQNDIVTINCSSSEQNDMTTNNCSSSEQNNMANNNCSSSDQNDMITKNKNCGLRKWDDVPTEICCPLKKNDVATQTSIPSEQNSVATMTCSPCDTGHESIAEKVVDPIERTSSTPLTTANDKQQDACRCDQMDKVAATLNQAEHHLLQLLGFVERQQLELNAYHSRYGILQMNAVDFLPPSEEVGDHSQQQQQQQQQLQQQQQTLLLEQQRATLPIVGLSDSEHPQQLHQPKSHMDLLLQQQRKRKRTKRNMAKNAAIREPQMKQRRVIHEPAVNNIASSIRSNNQTTNTPISASDFCFRTDRSPLKTMATPKTFASSMAAGATVFTTVAPKMIVPVNKPVLFPSHPVSGSPSTAAFPCNINFCHYRERSRSKRKRTRTLDTATFSKTAATTAATTTTTGSTTTTAITSTSESVNQKTMLLIGSSIGRTFDALGTPKTTTSVIATDSLPTTAANPTPMITTTHESSASSNSVVLETHLKHAVPTTTEIAHNTSDDKEESVKILRISGFATRATYSQHDQAER